MLKNKFILFTFLVIVSTLIASDERIFTEYSATPQHNQVKITWTTVSEIDVYKFIILRSSDGNSFTILAEINSKGPGTNYSYIDSEVLFKDASAKFYKIKAVKQNGHQVDMTSAMLVHPNISGIKRTWGAIKALFR